MIETKLVEKLVQEKIKESALFLVEVKVDVKNNITVFVDSEQGVSIDQCVEISRHIEQSFDRETEDFSLEVSSPGIGYPFRVVEQYRKAQGRTVDVVLLSGQKIEGTLTNISNGEITVSYTVKEKPEGAKRPKMVNKETIIKLDDIKSTKEIILF